MSNGVVLGIDLGTTNSACAVVEGGKPRIVVNSEGDRTTPSVVSFPEPNERVVGKLARKKLTKDPEHTVYSVKRHMGEEGYAEEIRGKEYTPEQISAMVLNKIKTEAEESLDRPVEGAVVTVPAYFNDRQRQATKDAGRLADLDIKRIVNEPTAAAMAYGHDDDEDKTILVYDLGGGTFDVSILDLSGGVYDVIATNGDNDLGGDDWTVAIAEHLATEFNEEHGIDLREDPQARQRILEAAEEAKKELSSREQTDIELPFIATTDEGTINLETKITRDTFEDITADLIEGTIAPAENALEDAGMGAKDIDEVVLIGGSTRMPQVREKVKQLTGVEAKTTINPDEAVALGAAIQGAVLSDGDSVGEDMVLLDVTPHSLGVETANGKFTTLIPRNTTIPESASKVFTTAKDDQATVRVGVYQGESAIAAENDFLDQFALRGIKPADAGDPRIEVTFKIDQNGIVNVEAEDQRTGSSQSLTVGGGTGLSEEEFEEMKEELET